MNIGIKGKQTCLVTKENTALTMGSGDLEVFASPAMIALMEKTCMLSLNGLLEEGNTSVGTYLDIKHISATPLGVNVYCESELVEIDRKRLVFNVKVYDEQGLIGEGKHERFIINAKKFMDKTKEKIQK